RERADREQKRVARQKGRYNQPSFSKNDHKKQRINQSAVILDKGDKVILCVQEELEKLLEQIHKRTQRERECIADGKQFPNFRVRLHPVANASREFSRP
ncbi:MAG: hypothetical protein WCC08_13605, partial [Terrimicrobiaceae bacterium]